MKNSKLSFINRRSNIPSCIAISNKCNVYYLLADHKQSYTGQLFKSTTLAKPPAIYQHKKECETYGAAGVAVLILTLERDAALRAVLVVHVDHDGIFCGQTRRYVCFQNRVFRSPVFSQVVCKYKSWIGEGLEGFKYTPKKGAVT